MENKDFKYLKALEFTKMVEGIGEIKVTDIKAYDKKRIKRNLFNIAEVLLDKAILQEMDEA